MSDSIDYFLVIPNEVHEIILKHFVRFEQEDAIKHYKVHTRSLEELEKFQVWPKYYSPRDKILTYQTIQYSGTYTSGLISGWIVPAVSMVETLFCDAYSLCALDKLIAPFMPSPSASRLIFHRRYSLEFKSGQASPRDSRDPKWFLNPNVFDRAVTTAEKILPRFALKTFVGRFDVEEFPDIVNVWRLIVAALRQPDIDSIQIVIDGHNYEARRQGSMEERIASGWRPVPVKIDFSETFTSTIRHIDITCSELAYTGLAYYPWSLISMPQLESSNITVYDMSELCFVEGIRPTDSFNFKQTKNRQFNFDEHEGFAKLLDDLPQSTTITYS